MKNAKVFLAALVFVGNVAAASVVLASADGVISKDELTTGSYCHEQFPAIEGRTLPNSDPSLKSASSGDIIDYYGPCDEKPTGQDQKQEQRLDYEHRWENNFED